MTLDPGNERWMLSWAPDLPFSRKVDAAITLLRSQVEAQAETVSDPKLDLLRRAGDLLQAAKEGRAADLEDVVHLVEAVFEGVD